MSKKYFFSSLCVVVLVLSACTNKDEEICQQEFFQPSEQVLIDLKEKNYSESDLQKVTNHFNFKKNDWNEKWKSRRCVERRTDGIDEANKLAEELKQLAFKARYIK